MIEDAVDMSNSAKPSGTAEGKGRLPKGQMFPEHLLPGTTEKIRRTVVREGHLIVLPGTESCHGRVSTGSEECM